MNRLFSLPIIITLFFLFQPVTSYSQAPDSLGKYNKVLLRESFHLANQIQDSVWPGWSNAPFGIILINKDWEYLLSHPKPSQEFRNFGYDSFLKDSIYMRKREFSPNLKATFPAVGGIPTIVIGLPDSLGSPSDWVLTVLHEHFHQWQMSRPDYYSSVDSLNLSNGDKTGQWMLNYPFPYDSAKVVNSFNKLTHRLKAAIEAIEKPDFKNKLENYLNARKEFQTILAPTDYRYFSFQLWQEGVARYIEYKTAKLASIQYRPSKDFKMLDAYKSYKDVSEEIFNRVISRLTNLSLKNDKRVAFYPVGAAEAILIDYVNPNWHKLYWKEKFYLEEYLDPSK